MSAEKGEEERNSFFKEEEVDQILLDSVLEYDSQNREANVDSLFTHGVTKSPIEVTSYGVSEERTNELRYGVTFGQTQPEALCHNVTFVQTQAEECSESVVVRTNRLERSYGVVPVNIRHKESDHDEKRKFEV